MNTCAHGISDVVLWMDNSSPDRLVPNKIMLNTRAIFLMDNHRDIMGYEYNEILKDSGCAGIVKE